MILRSTDGQPDLPRYFAQVFRIASGLKHGRLDFVLADGRRFRAEGKAAGPLAEIHVVDDDIFARLIREGDLGFSEAYLEGGWTTPDLQAFMDMIHADNDSVYDGFPGMGVLRAYERLRHLLRSNSRGQARRNIAYHYDLGNAFYALWLDRSMTYSSALFRSGQESLEAAQRAKYASMVDRMGVGPGDHVLEIGCGWGGFAEYAAGERGLRVTGLTISQAQLDFARARIARAGLGDRVDLRLQDYRDERGAYDGIASIEMFEAVGEAYWPAYFAQVRDRLVSGGRAALQIITIDEEIFPRYRRELDFIRRYIFPGGMLPTRTILEKLGAGHDLALVAQRAFGRDYALTLAQWRDRFRAAWPDIMQQGFDERFRRLWEYYLSYCEAGFRSGAIDVRHIIFARR